MTQQALGQHKAPPPAGAQLARVHGPAGAGALHNVTCLLGPGIHAFLGAPSDGTTALVELCAGRARPRLGSVWIGGGEPASRPELRRRIATLLPRPELPPLGTVSETAARLGLDTAAALATLGAERYAQRTVKSLSPQEARLVELAFALSVRDPIAWVLYEPFAFIAPFDTEGLRGAASERASEGVTVVLATSSLAGLEGFAGHLYILEKGALAGAAIEGDWLPRGAAELAVVLEQPREARGLSQLLGEDGSVSGVAWDDAGVVRVRAADSATAGRAIAAAAVSCGCQIVSVRPSPRARSALLAESKRRLAERVTTTSSPLSPPAAADPALPLPAEDS